MMSMARFFNLGDERGVLKLAIGATLFVALFGIIFGLLSGSFAIMFDGVYSLVDASMGLLTLVVVNLITSHATPARLSRRLRERFTMGFWHLEPMVLGLNGLLLTGVAVYALINAIASLLDGGRELEFGFAIVYTVITVIVCVLMATLASRANRDIGSDFIRLDIRAWIMSGCITGALLVAFCIGYAVQDTSWQWISPFIDPAVLAVVCLVIIPLPIPTVKQALSDTLLITPSDLKRHVDEVAGAMVKKYAFDSFRAYIARVGRARQIELYFIVTPESPAQSVAQWDAIRDEVGAAIGGDGPDRWLTIAFTGNPEWAE